MVSSTFAELKEHRADVISAIQKLDFHPTVMENSGAQADKDVIDTSLQMVRDAIALICVISHRYGQIPEDPRNPDRLSISEMEFDEAIKNDLPILLFIMGDDHPVKPTEVELDADKRAKLEAFREKGEEDGTRWNSQSNL